MTNTTQTLLEQAAEYLQTLGFKVRGDSLPTCKIFNLKDVEVELNADTSSKVLLMIHSRGEASPQSQWSKWADLKAVLDLVHSISSADQLEPSVETIVDLPEFLKNRTP